ncbi:MULTISPECIES: aspartate aminotransferase family protein [Thalassobaculum]|uniref:Beta-alanine--pyruvate transaminase n=1 Tax=Thalassobaculum litoreum DSM 18839 TaxID=1123362 RepID=A0A8G2BIH8_9PROT|nr:MULTISPECIES: aspartate aminotransferase family protein [Thalassobaculum]SDF64233.1 beta-alanine--pyruvate transaminase [Thalassobaculum litoreum DSM 18839]
MPLAANESTKPNDLESFWMPFTSNRDFKQNPRLFVEAEGMHYITADGRRVLDGTSGLWCSNAGHRRKPIVDAIKKQAEVLDFAPAFQMGHPLSFEFASRLTQMIEGFDHVFFTNSGSESVDTALKIALAYQRARGQGTRTRLIGRERGYHGVGFGGISVGGIVGNRKQFGTLLNGVDHMRHTHDMEHNAYTKGEPDWGAHLADDLERIVALHDASTIAAVIVEPVAGSTGVLIPPKGYLQRLRDICDKHGILLIFDEVITGFGRLGTPFGSDYFGVKPDIFTTAKGITNATVPMGAVFCRDGIYDAFMDAPEGAIELFHGYTYSGHPLACAAGLATIDLYRDEGLFERAAELAPYWEDAMHSLKGSNHVIDIRNLGMVGAIELEGIAGKPTARAMDAFKQCYDKGLLVRTTGDIIALSPPLIVEKGQIDFIADTIGDVLRTLH